MAYRSYHDVLEADSIRKVDGLFSQGNSLDLHPEVGRKAYLAILDEVKKEEDSKFFEGYMAYRLLMCTSSSELLANMIALDKPEYLFYVVERDEVYGVPFDPRLLDEYIIWKYKIKETPNDPADAFAIIDFLGRYEHPYRIDAVGVIRYNDLMPLFEAALETERHVKAWTEIFAKEPGNRKSILIAKGIVEEKRDSIRTLGDVNKLIQAISYSARIIDPVERAFVAAILGRFKYIPSA